MFGSFFDDGRPRKATKWDHVFFWVYLGAAGVLSWWFFPGFAGV